MKNINSIIKKLFQEKRFKELVNLVENKIDRSKQTSKFINIYAISKIFSLGINTKNLVFVIKEFENSFISIHLMMTRLQHLYILQIIA